MPVHSATRRKPREPRGRQLRVCLLVELEMSITNVAKAALRIFLEAALQQTANR